MMKLLSKKSFVSLQIAVLLLVVINASAQSGKGYWHSTSEAARKQAPIAENKRTLTKFKLMELDLNSLKSALSGSPKRNQSETKSNTIVTFPNAAGNFQSFRVVEFSNMEPALAAAYPEIKSYVGNGIEDPSAIIYFSLSPLGLSTMLLSADKAAEFIEPYTTDQSTYVVYRKNDKTFSSDKFECTIVNSLNETMNHGGLNNRPNADDKSFRTYRLALSVTGEYTAHFGGTVALALAAMNTTMTRVNGVCEIDFSLHMNMIANETAIIYTNASTDPYSSATAGAGGAWNSELQANLTSVIGNGGYDIGHLFGASGGGGSAGCIGCVCVANQKGSGFTSPVDGIPSGDNFDIDYVVHEMGHQFGANHTFTFSNEGTGKQMEPGSGTTIMGYAGITVTADVQPHSDAYFHAISVEQVTAYIKSTTCQVNTTTNNPVPTADAGVDRTIPKGTPFALTGIATDSNDVSLTYCWEQMNSGSSSTTFPSVTAMSGAAFRSFIPTSSPTRYFPQLSTIKTGATSSTWEAVPNVARTMAFRFTVRDNHAGGPANNSDDMVVTVSTSSGPFIVTAPNTAVTWAGGTTQTVTWNVASTTAAPVSCANVKILLSTDGGNTFSNILIASTANDGTESITVPNIATSQARIKVEAVGNIFFDISNANFTITAAAGLTTISTSAIVPLNYCAGAAINVPFTTNAAANAGNVFTAQLSDSLGNFPGTNIGTLTSTAAGTIAATISGAMATGTGYRIRVVSSNPVVMGSVNVSSISISAQVATAGGISGAFTSFCSNIPVMFSIGSITNATNYTWSIPAPGIILSGQGTTSITIAYPPGQPDVVGAISVFGSNTNCTGIASSLAITAWSSPVPSISGNTVFCSGASSVLDAGSGYAVYQWSTGATTQSISVNTANTFTVTVSNATGCSGSASATTTVNPLPIVSFTGLASSYNVGAAAAVLTGSPSGGTFAGAGISGNTFTPSSAGVGGPYTVTYSYSNTNGCSKSSSQQTTVTSNCTLPVQPGTISTVGGAVKVCPGNTKSYKITAVVGATSYLWTAPLGGSITSGQGTVSITINYTAGFTANDSLKVAAVNACGTGANRTLLISRNVPATPSAITGSLYGVCSLNGVAYTVTNVAGMTYNWSFSVATGTVASGQGTNSITANFAPAYITGILNVSATNACGTGATRTATIRATPATPVSITGSATVCANQSGVPYSISAIPNTVNYTWTVPTGAHINDGSTTSASTTMVTTATAVTVNFATTSGNVRARANNICGSGSYLSKPVTFNCRNDQSLSEDLNVTCYPMPASNHLNVEFFSVKEQASTIRVFNIIGNTLLSQTNNSTTGDNHFAIDLSNIASGIYILEVRTGNQSELQKIVVE